MDCSPPCSSVHGIIQARILSGLPCLSPGDLPGLGIKPASPKTPALQANSLLLTHQGSPRGNTRNYKYPTTLYRCCSHNLEGYFKLKYSSDIAKETAVSVSSLQQSESAVCIYVSPLFAFPFRSLQSPEYSSLCYTVGSR